MSTLKDIVKAITRLVLGEYSIFRIYSIDSNTQPQEQGTENPEFKIAPIEAKDLERGDALIQEQASYFGCGTCTFGGILAERVVAICAYWYGERYKKRNFWPLQESEAKLVQIITSPEARGRGIASRLIEKSANAMFEQGFRRLYARIWHSNEPSIRAFQRAGWKEIAVVLEVNPLRRSRPMKFTFHTSRR